MSCTEDGCKRTAYYNVAGEERKYCKDHKREGMVQVPKHKCKAEGCTEEATNEYEKGKGVTWNTYCKEHTLKEEKVIEDEVWKEILGYEGSYWVSNKGRVKSSNRILKNNSSKKTGHERISLSYLGVTTRYSVHRLVAEAFLEREGGKDVVDHIDHNPRNNEISNLRWVTHRENSWNRKKQANKTGYKHVSKVGNRYQAVIARCVGTYDTAEEAHKAACEYLKSHDVFYKQYAHIGYTSEALQG